MKVERLSAGDETAGEGAGQWRSLRPAALLLAASLGGTALLGVVAPRPAATMAVIGAPWWDAPRMAGIAVAAGARLVDAGRFDNVLIVRRAEGEEIDLAAALYSAGAWLVLDAAGPRGCLAGFSG
ncbi:hypothetical protein BKE38_22610 [Pseudoroseomonas deserti]|uniref:Uncharacterized protein n=1 Tax=Teichococcus deserti TaxID=1817963 RepID=A0A1V2GWS0_9PROT|nr:hypothetical protein [Pseudoroseomonas deserti]ONG47814.1 hypothetical protein BKE38_22610 [Pseudoroseomonas deserti]